MSSKVQDAFLEKSYYSKPVKREREELNLTATKHKQGCKVWTNEEVDYKSVEACKLKIG